MRLGIPVGRVGGVPVYLRPSWFLVAALMTIVFAPTVRDRTSVSPGVEYVVAFGFALILLASVFVHELAHAGAAAAAGSPASHIVLDLWGGHTTFTERSARPPASAVISGVGPLSNLLLWALARSVDAGDPFGVPQVLIDFTAAANLLLAAFNALPGLPLDGGGVLEALVWRATGNRHRGTVAAGWAGRGVALLIAGWTLMQLIGGSGSPAVTVWLLLAAGFLWLAAGQAIAGADWLRQAGRARAEDLAQPAIAVPSDWSVLRAQEAASAAGATAVVVLDVYGKPAAVVDDQAAAGVPTDRRAEVTARTVAHPLPEGAVLPAGLDGEALLERLQGSPAARYVVVDAEHRVAGVLDWDDVAQFLTRG
jgi:Zn-dependent protease